MGYYTNYEIEMSLDGTPIIKSNFEENVGSSWDDFLKSFYDETGYDFANTSDVKWYDWRKDMIALSTLFPNLLFTIKGDGEESDDYWKCYFKNGLSQNAKAKIVFDEFDPEKLK